jgi:hypothetical protein
VLLGRQYKRDDPVSGLLLIDPTGTERGGYVTSDEGGNALLTLDGRGFQTALLLAEADGSTTLRLWDRGAAAAHGTAGNASTHSSITMGSWADGPFLNLKRDGSLLSAQPPGNRQSTDSRPLFR